MSREFSSIGKGKIDCTVACWDQSHGSPVNFTNVPRMHVKYMPGYSFLNSQDPELTVTELAVCTDQNAFKTDNGDFRACVKANPLYVLLEIN